MRNTNKKTTSWQNISDWYKKTVGPSGHYYHKQVILPNVSRIVNGGSVLDLGCGNGILARSLKFDNYLGIDLSASLIDEAKRIDPKNKYLVADITRTINLKEKFDWAVIILALQNLKKPYKAIENASNNLKKNGKILLVINHPCFRIPKQSDWMVKNGRQYRIVGHYMTPLEIPIESSPFDKKDNQLSWSYHYPLSAYSQMLASNGFLIERIEEWVSDKVSTGGAARMENIARAEIPMFMAIVARLI